MPKRRMYLISGRRSSPAHVLMTDRWLAYCGERIGSYAVSATRRGRRICKRCLAAVRKAKS